MTMLMPPPQVHKHSLMEQAYGSVKRMILSLDLPPGGQFTEAQISHELMLGKTPRERSPGPATERASCRVHPPMWVPRSSPNIQRHPRPFRRTGVAGEGGG